MSARELSRHTRDDGMTDVVVAIGATDRLTITVLSSIVDGPGYQDMLDAALAKQGRLRDVVRGAE